MKAACALRGRPRGLERSLSSNILHTLIPLLGAGIEAVLSAGKHLPVGVCIFKIIRRLGGAARQKQCQSDNNNICQNPVSSAFSHERTCCCENYATTWRRYIARKGTQQLCDVGVKSTLGPLTLVAAVAAGSLQTAQAGRAYIQQSCQERKHLLGAMQELGAVAYGPPV
jgi:hypothetical protein